MKAFLKANYRLLWTALIAALAGVAAGAAIGFRGGRDATIPAEVRIGPETRIERIMHFDACSHETESGMDTAAYVGYTRSDLAAHFPEASIIRFSADEVLLMQAQDGYCPRHYVLRLRDDGMLGVTQTDDAFYTEELVTLVAKEPAQFLPSERNSLEAGLPFNSLSEIDAYLESIGS